MQKWKEAVCSFKNFYVERRIIIFIFESCIIGKYSKVYRTTWDNSQTAIQGESKKFEVKQVTETARNLKNGRACGPESLPAELLKNGTSKLLQRLLTYLSNIRMATTRQKNGKLNLSHRYTEGSKQDGRNYKVNKMAVITGECQLPSLWVDYMGAY
jgi:hypothetical protein